MKHKELVRLIRRIAREETYEILDEHLDIMNILRVPAKFGERQRLKNEKARVLRECLK